MIIDLILDVGLTLVCSVLAIVYVRGIWRIIIPAALVIGMLFYGSYNPSGSCPVLTRYGTSYASGENGC